MKPTRALFVHTHKTSSRVESSRPARATTTTTASARDGATARRAARDEDDDARGVDDARGGVGDEDAREGVANASCVLLDIIVVREVVGGVERRRARGIRVARTRRALRTTRGRGDGDSTRGVVAGIRCRKFSLRRIIRAIGKRRVDVRLGAGFLWAGRVVAGVG
jgi:hypothetical protein